MGLLLSRQLQRRDVYYLETAIALRLDTDISVQKECRAVGHRDKHRYDGVETDREISAELWRQSASEILHAEAPKQQRATRRSPASFSIPFGYDYQR